MILQKTRCTSSEHGYWGGALEHWQGWACLTGMMGELKKDKIPLPKIF